MVRQKKQGRWKRPLTNKTLADKKTSEGKWSCPQHGKEFQVRSYKRSRYCGECGWKSLGF